MTAAPGSAVTVSKKHAVGSTSTVKPKKPQTVSTYGTEPKGLKRKRVITKTSYEETPLSETESTESQRKRTLINSELGLFEDLAPEDSRRFRKIKGVSYHIGNSVCQDITLW